MLASFQSLAPWMSVWLQIQGALRDDMLRLRQVFHEVLFRAAPGARN
jgi:hypothetical protein